MSKVDVFLRLVANVPQLCEGGDLKYLIVRHYKAQNEDTNFQFTRQPRSRKADVGGSLFFCRAMLSAVRFTLK
ncbi:MAG: hypothetical protein HY841_01215 [Bacteroidetes bacterium]|nr:hypothetical protein [Bacteroidota bacterium]